MDADKNEEKKSRRRMTGRELDRIRSNLLERKRILWNQILDDLDSEAIEQHRDIVENMRESGERALEDLRESNAIQFVEFKVRELEQIEEAINRIDSDEYGTCKECGRWIRPARLEVMPYAVRCIKCQEQREKIENV